MTTNPPNFYRERDLLAGVVPFSHATLWRRVSDGSFPAPCRPSPGVTAWKREGVEAWLKKVGGAG